MKIKFLLVLVLFIYGCQSSIVKIEKFSHLASKKFSQNLDIESYPESLKQESLIFTLDVEGVGPDIYRSWLKIYSSKDSEEIKINSINHLIKDQENNLLGSPKTIDLDGLDSKLGLYFGEVYFTIPAVTDKSISSFFIQVIYKTSEDQEKSILFEIERYEYRDIAWPT